MKKAKYTSALKAQVEQIKAFLDEAGIEYAFELDDDDSEVQFTPTRGLN